MCKYACDDTELHSTAAYNTLSSQQISVGYPVELSPLDMVPQSSSNALGFPSYNLPERTKKLEYKPRHGQDQLN